MKTNGILIHAKDQVVTLTCGVQAGETVCYVREGILLSQKASEAIPQYHKMAVQEIEKGRKVYKYGEEIGEAIQEICAGEWVHVHNLQSTCMVSGKNQGKGEALT